MALDWTVFSFMGLTMGLAKSAVSLERPETNSAGFLAIIISRRFLAFGLFDISLAKLVQFPLPPETYSYLSMTKIVLLVTLIGLSKDSLMVVNESIDKTEP